MRTNFIYILTLFFAASNFIVKSQPTVGLLLNKAEAYNGYTLFAPTESKLTYLINNCGEVVNEWLGTELPAYTVYLLVDGSLLRVSRGLLERLSWSGELLWQSNIGDDLNLRNHHDIAPLPNGNILVIAGEYLSIEAAIKNGRNPANLDNKVSVDFVVEIEPIGTGAAKIVWEWHFWDHLIQNYDEGKTNFGEVSKNIGKIDINIGSSMSDWLHCNAIDYHPQLDQILLSSPYTSELYIIDHSTSTEEAATDSGGRSGKGGDFLWRWGNPIMYQSGATTDRKLFGQHDPKWIKKGYPYEGNISVFNNNFEPQSSAIHLINMQINEDETYPLNQNTFLPANYIWTFNGDVLGKPFFNAIKSGVNIQPNGNFLVGLGTGLIFEVTPEKALVWAYKNPAITVSEIALQNDTVKAEIFRAERYPNNYVAFTDKDLSPKGIIENKNLLSKNCMLPTAQPASVSPVELSVYPNPASQFVYIQSSKTSFTTTIFDVSGHLILQTKAKKINIAALKNGLYYLHIDEKANYVQQLLVVK